MFCKNCGNEVDAKAVACPNCGYGLKVKKSPFKKWWFWLLVIVWLIVVIAVAASGEGGSAPADTTSDTSQTTTTMVNIPTEFSTPCPIEVSAIVADNIIGVPEVQCHIKNKTDKDIAAVEMYFVPKDVYGDVINTIMTTNKLTTDNSISANGSCTRSWQMLEQNVKAGDLYVYSVFFSDGTEWGDKDAGTTKIKKYGQKIVVEN